MKATFDEIDRDSPVPLYLQIRQRLVGMIADWPDPEQRFPTDDELSKMFDVAKATVRQALGDLTQSGLLRRKRGAGTFVVPPLIENLRPTPDNDAPYELVGAAVSYHVHAYEQRGARASEARALKIDEGAPIVFFRRVRSLAHVPVAIDERVMTLAMAEALDFSVDKASESIIGRVQRRVGLTHASWRLSATLAGQRDAMLLQITPSDPVLVRSLVYLSDALPILAGETRHRSDMVRCGFEMDLSSKDTGGAMQTWTDEALLGVSSEQASAASPPGAAPS